MTLLVAALLVVASASPQGELDPPLVDDPVDRVAPANGGEEDSRNTAAPLDGAIVGYRASAAITGTALAVLAVALALPVYVLCAIGTSEAVRGSRRTSSACRPVCCLDF